MQGKTAQGQVQAQAQIGRWSTSAFDMVGSSWSGLVSRDTQMARGSAGGVHTRIPLNRTILEGEENWNEGETKQNTRDKATGDDRDKEAQESKGRLTVTQGRLHT